MVVVLIFPKAFELFKFLSFLKNENFKILYIQEKTNEHGLYEIEVRKSLKDDNDKLDKELVYHFFFMLIKESDINFRKVFQTNWEQVIFNKHIDSNSNSSNSSSNGDNCNNKKQKSKIILVLIGSCGSPNKNDFAKLFYIEKAIKHDRGDLREDRVFTIREDKKISSSWYLDEITKSKIIWSNSKMSKRNINTTNFINQSIIDDSNYSGNLLDMETWDFYDICQSLKENGTIDGYASIRFVTDIADDPNKINIKTDDIQKLLNGKSEINLKSLYDQIYNIFEKQQQQQQQQHQQSTTNGADQDNSIYYNFLKSLNVSKEDENSPKLKKLVRWIIPIEFNFVFDIIEPSIVVEAQTNSSNSSSSSSKIDYYSSFVWYKHFSNSYSEMIIKEVEILKNNHSINVTLSKEIKDSWEFGEENYKFNQFENKLIINSKN